MAAARVLLCLGTSAATSIPSQLVGSIRVQALAPHLLRHVRHASQVNPKLDIDTLRHRKDREVVGPVVTHLGCDPDQGWLASV